jgi:pyridoxal phosphate enzyme (YggS family)
VQGLCSAAEAFAGAGREATWHFIGRLQRNKINKLMPHVGAVHTVDSDALADALAKRAPQGGLDVLVQVNVGAEPQKGGVPVNEAVRFARTVATRAGLRLRGLMGMPPMGQDPRPYFDRLAALSRELRATPEGEAARDLSMGMTGDFEAAIACGSTMVRVGTAIFGPRNAQER